MLAGRGFFCSFGDMYQRLDCVALRTIKHSDRSSILVAYSRQMGRVGLLIAAGKGAAASRVRALTMPMASFECVASVTPGRELFHIRDVRPDDGVAPGYGTLDPVRSAVGFFMADFLSAVLREPMADEPLFGGVREIARCIAGRESRGLANVHIAALASLTVPLGIEPDVSTWRRGRFLDLREGRFTVSPPSAHSDYLDQCGSHIAWLLSRMTLRNARFYRFSRDERNEILRELLRYYTLHGYKVGNLVSVDILRDLF